MSRPEFPQLGKLPWRRRANGRLDRSPRSPEMCPQLWTRRMSRPRQSDSPRITRPCSGMPSTRRRATSRLAGHTSSRRPSTLLFALGGGRGVLIARRASARPRSHPRSRDHARTRGIPRARGMRCRCAGNPRSPPGRCRVPGTMRGQGARHTPHHASTPAAVVERVSRLTRQPRRSSTPTIVAPYVRAIAHLCALSGRRCSASLST